MLEIWGRRKSTPIEGGIKYFWNAEYYTFSVRDEDETDMVRDENHAQELITSLVAGNWKNEKPMPDIGFVPWFSIAINITNTRKKKSTYSIDYRKWDRCPFEAISEGMDIYRKIKRNIKKSHKENKKGIKNEKV